MNESPSTNERRPWLFGPGIDLLFGCGIAYVIVTGILGILQPPMDRVQGWLPFVILFTGLPHYGATLERVYSTPEARRHYGRYALGFGLLIGAAFLITVISGRGGSALVTLYLTWSPWHYAAQNFGLVMMFLRRAQVEIDLRFRLAIRTSFVLSFLLVFVNIHRGSAAAANDPLYAVPSARDAVRFVPLGLSENMTPVLLVVLGVAYALVTIGVVVTMIRRTPAGMGAPALSLIFSQWAWFVMPVVLSQFVPWWFAPGGPTALAFSWVAIAHSVQYLWISLHFARVSGRTSLLLGSLARYYGLAIFAGAAIWVFPVLFSVKGGLTRMPHESGLDMLVAAAVNLHHFLLDGVIWKLRDAPVRQALVDGHAQLATPHPAAPKMPWGRVLVAGAGTIAVVCWVIAAWEQEVGRRWSVARGDLERLQIAERRLNWVGRDGPRIHQAMAKLLQNRGDDRQAMGQYQRSIELWPTSGAWLGLGKIHEKAGRLAEAQAAYENAVAIEPNHASGLDDLAHVLANRGQVELAIKIQRRALEAAPDRRDLRRRYDALLVRLPVHPDEVEEVIIDLYDGGVPESGP